VGMMIMGYVINQFDTLCVQVPYRATLQAVASQTEPDFVSSDDQLCLPVQVTQLAYIYFVYLIL